MSHICPLLVEINGKEFEMELEFDYTPAVRGVLNALPENCYPDEPEEINPCNLYMRDDKDNINYDIMIPLIDDDDIARAVYDYFEE